MAKKRFSPKELAEWIYKTASEAITDEDMTVVYYKLVGGGLACDCVTLRIYKK